MPLEQATRRFLDLAAASFDVRSQDLNDIRARSGALQRQWDVPQVDVHREADQVVCGPQGSIPVRVYWPREAERTTPPILIAFHGGGWVLGNLNLYDNLCRHLCKYAAMIVVSVDYRLAPEHTFPAAIDDAYAALCWVARHAAQLGGDVERVAVGGDSAGGNLAAVLCHLSKRNAGPKIWKQLLFYPSVAIGLDDRYPSRARYGTDEYGLPEAVIRHSRTWYAPDPSDHRDVRLSPILADDFSGLPPAMILTPEFDPLRDEGEHYAALLHAAGVATTYRCYPGVVHGFVGQSGIVGVGLEALRDAVAFLREAV